MTAFYFCTCDNFNCVHHPKNSDGSCKACVAKNLRSDYGSLAELHKPIKEIADREGWEMIRTSGCPYGKEDPIWALYHECRRRNYGY